MTAASLSSGPVMGVLNASGSSPVFSTGANQPASVIIGLSRLAASSAAQLMRSTDSGQTWAPVQFRQARCYTVATLNDQNGALYRIDVTLAGGTAVFCASNALFFGAWSPDLIEPGDPIGTRLSATTTQYLNLCSVQVTPLTASQIAAPLTIYKRCRNGIIATLSL